MTMKTYCIADDNISFKQTFEIMLKSSCNDNMEQDDEQRVHSWRAQEHPKDYINSDGAVPEISDRVLEAAWKAKDANESVGVIMGRNKVRNKDNRDIRPANIKSKGCSNHGKKNDYSNEKKSKGPDQWKYLRGKNPKGRRLSISADETTTTK